MRAARVPFWATIAALILLAFSVSAEQIANVNDLPSDLAIPVLSEGAPAAGKRVKQSHPQWAGSKVYHVLYLPEDWTPEKKWPLLVEYPGNGNFKNKQGDVSSGEVENCKLGYGISGGKGIIWVVLPFVNPATGANQLTWWGDAEVTAEYCVKTVRWLSEKYNADPEAVLLSGFSRGSIAVSYIGLRNDEIAKLWRGFICHSHYDGVRKWPHADSDSASAILRLKRLAGRPQYISHESNVESPRIFLEKAGLANNCRFVSLPFPNHTDVWVLKDLPERRELRTWVAECLKK